MKFFVRKLGQTSPSTEVIPSSHGTVFTINIKVGHINVQGDVTEITVCEDFQIDGSEISGSVKNP